MDNKEIVNKEDDLFSNVWTIPNILSFGRIFLIPVFAVLFYMDYLTAALIVLFISGLSDFFDGKIARKYNQISPLGKILDPFADKLTQITIAIMLFFEFLFADSNAMRMFSWVFLFFLLKEAVMIIGGIMMLKRGMRPGAAEIYGKVATFVFYGVMLVIIGFGPEVGAFVRKNPDIAISETTTMILVVIAAILTFVALMSYAPATIRMFKENKANRENENKEKGK